MWVLDLAAASADPERRQACKAYNGIPHAQAAGSKAYQVGPSWRREVAVIKEILREIGEATAGDMALTPGLVAIIHPHAVGIGGKESRSLSPNSPRRLGQAGTSTSCWRSTGRGAGQRAGPRPYGPASAYPAPYAPERQPAERLWPLTNAALANKHFHDIDELQEVQTQRCLALQALPHVI